MTNTYVDMDGVVNVSVGLIKNTKRDFIKGAKYLYSKMKKIPTQKELLKSSKYHNLSSNYDVRWMYDAWRFVRDDPYQLFSDVGEESVINEWKMEAIEAYYRLLYINGAVILFKNNVDKELLKLKDGEIVKSICDRKIAEDFIEARNYISTTSHADVLFKEWNRVAYDRIRRPNHNKKS